MILFNREEKGRVWFLHVFLTSSVFSKILSPVKFISGNSSAGKPMRQQEARRISAFSVWPIRAPFRNSLSWVSCAK